MSPSIENPTGLSPPSDADRPCQLEFLVEPFAEGNPGPHVLGPLASLRRHGIEVSQGPFGNTVEGDRRTIATAVLTILESAFDNGASRILVNLAQGVPTHTEPASTLTHRADYRRQMADGASAGGGMALGGERPEDIHGAVERIVQSVEARLGGRLGELSREKKQAAVRILDEQGVFLIRKSVDTVAAAMGVSRITIYNYLNAIRGD